MTAVKVVTLVTLVAVMTVVKVVTEVTLGEGFQRPVGMESNSSTLCAFELFIHAGNVDSAREDLCTGTRGTG